LPVGLPTVKAQQGVVQLLDRARVEARVEVSASMRRRRAAESGSQGRVVDQAPQPCRDRGRARVIEEEPGLAGQEYACAVCRARSDYRLAVRRRGSER
jgi:hypothetical protein